MFTVISGGQITSPPRGYPAAALGDGQFFLDSIAADDGDVLILYRASGSLWTVRLNRVGEVLARSQVSQSQPHDAALARTPDGGFGVFYDTAHTLRTAP